MQSLYSLYPFSRRQPGLAGRLAYWLLLIAAVVAFVLPLTVLAGVTPVTHRVANCSWDHPGVNPFMGELPAAVDRYTDIPASVRARLKERMARRDYDDIAVIKRDSIEGRSSYDPTIRDMHFGTDRVCNNVSRSAWSPSQQERGLVYCEAAQCLIVPTVCRNVSRVTRRPAAPAAVAGDPAAAPPADELVFDAPGAGPVADGTVPGAGGPVGGGGGGQYPLDLPFAAGGFGAPIANTALLDAPTYGSGAPANNGNGSGAIGDPAAPRDGPAADLLPAVDSPLPFQPALPDPPFGALPEGGPTFPGPAPVAAVPEPGTWALMLLGLGGVLLARRAKTRAKMAA